jgi:hypothetical protein
VYARTTVTATGYTTAWAWTCAPTSTEASISTAAVAASKTLA